MTWKNFKRIIRHIILVQTFTSSLSSAIPAAADSSDPRLAAYYDDFLALCGSNVFEWSNMDSPQKRMSGVKQVGVGKNNRYALTEKGVLLVWSNDPTETTVVMDAVHSFYAGRSGLFVIRDDRSLWTIEISSRFGIGEKLTENSARVAENVLAASIGDGTNYYVTTEGSLFVRGKAHRGQYGDGRLTSTERYVQTAKDVIQVVSHTGHALVLKRDGSVWGTGGNIYGPLSSHGFGDKAVQWGLIIDGVRAVATGRSHSLAIKSDSSLWIWGRNEGLEPKQVMTEVEAVAAGNDSTIAIRKGALWQWATGAQPKLLMKCG